MVTVSSSPARAAAGKGGGLSTAPGVHGHGRGAPSVARDGHAPASPAASCCTEVLHRGRYRAVLGVVVVVNVTVLLLEAAGKLDLSSGSEMEPEASEDLSRGMASVAASTARPGAGRAHANSSSQSGVDAPPQRDTRYGGSGSAVSGSTAGGATSLHDNAVGSPTSTTDPGPRLLDTLPALTLQSRSAPARRARNKYLAFACTYGRTSNRIIGLQTALGLAKVLGRTLAVPRKLFGTRRVDEHVEVMRDDGVWSTNFGEDIGGATGYIPWVYLEDLAANTPTLLRGGIAAELLPASQLNLDEAIGALASEADAGANATSVLQPLGKVSGVDEDITWHTRLALAGTAPFFADLLELPAGAGWRPPAKGGVDTAPPYSAFLWPSSEAGWDDLARRPEHVLFFGELLHPGQSGFLERSSMATRLRPGVHMREVARRFTRDNFVSDRGSLLRYVSVHIRVETSAMLNALPPLEDVASFLANRANATGAGAVYIASDHLTRHDVQLASLLQDRYRLVAATTRHLIPWSLRAGIDATPEMLVDHSLMAGGTAFLGHSISTASQVVVMLRHAQDMDSSGHLPPDAPHVAECYLYSSSAALGGDGSLTHSIDRCRPHRFSVFIRDRAVDAFDSRRVWNTGRGLDLPPLTLDDV